MDGISLLLLHKNIFQNIWITISRNETAGLSGNVVTWIMSHDQILTDPHPNISDYTNIFPNKKKAIQSLFQSSSLS